MTNPRTAPDRCPGVLRPWPAEDGALVRIRVPGGRLRAQQWHAVARAAQTHGDGRVHLTSRANLQVRGVGDVEAFAAGMEAAGLLPSRAHDVVRNILCSPLTGVLGGAADLRPTLRALDRAMLADPRIAGLPGKFLVALDDGRGDVVGRPHDLGCRALDEATVELTVDGHAWREAALPDVPAAVVGLMHRFLDARGAAWHVREIPSGAAGLVGDVRGEVAGTGVIPGFGSLGSGILHCRVPDGVIGAGEVMEQQAQEVVVTPWRSVLLLSNVNDGQET